MSDILLWLAIIYGESVLVLCLGFALRYGQARREERAADRAWLKEIGTTWEEDK